MHPAPLASTEYIAQGGGTGHWLRLMLPTTWSGLADGEPDRTKLRSVLERLRPLAGRGRQFLLAYTASLSAIAAFIA